MSRDRAETVIWKAEFNPSVRTYWLLSGVSVLGLSIVGIPLIPIWLLIGYPLTTRYVSRMSCDLTSKALKFGKGMFVRVEKTVPLDKITDLGLVQGPIMRKLDLETLSVETAGQSSAGSLLKLTGIVDTRSFRDAVLAQRDRLVATLNEDTLAPAAASPVAPEQAQLLIDIRDTLQRIEKRLPSA